MGESPPLPLRLLTLNIRYATPRPFPHELPWPSRLPLILSTLHFHTAYLPTTLLCLQEVLFTQLSDILTGLNQRLDISGGAEWKSIGYGRDDGKMEGEYNPILYRADVWRVEEWKQLWLSPTPETPSFGWDAGCKRVLVAGRFKHWESGKEVVGLCTHLDNAGSVARREGAKMIRGFVEGGWCREGGKEEGRALPVVLGGDFNSKPEEEAFRVLNAGESPVRDLRELTEEHHGNVLTYTGFEKEDEPSRIDFLFVGPRDRVDEYWKVDGYAVLENKFDDEVYASDHRPVIGNTILY